MTGLFASQALRRHQPSRTTKFFTDAQAGTLPNVTFLDPDYGTVVRVPRDLERLSTRTAASWSARRFVAEVYDALRKSPQWDRMVFVINFDEHGGFYDHVAPPTVTDDTDNPVPRRAPRLQAPRVPGAGDRDRPVRPEEGRDGRARTSTARC